MMQINNSKTILFLKNVCGLKLNIKHFSKIWLEKCIDREISLNPHGTPFTYDFQLLFVDDVGILC